MHLTARYQDAGVVECLLCMLKAFELNELG